MLILALTTDKLQLVTAQAVTVDVHVSFMDYNGTTVTPGKQNTAISTATTTDILAAPGASTQRNAKTIHARNKHATDSVVVTLVFDANATDYELHKVTLAAGESLEYIEGIGFFVLGAGSPIFVKSLAADQSNSTSTATEVTGLSLATAVGTFYFKYIIIYQAGVTTTGVKFSVNYDGTVTIFSYNIYGVSATITAADGLYDQDVVLATGGLFNVNAARVKGVAGLGASISTDSANADMLMLIEGLAVVTVAGNFELWHGAEVAAINTVKAGSSLVLTKTG